VEHAAGSARKGVAIAWHGAPAALVVVTERASLHASTYDSALFRVSRGTATRLVGDVTNVSAPLVSASGVVLVQRGHDGDEVVRDPVRRQLRERTDALRIDAVDLDTGAVRALWSGDGQIAYLATSMSADEVCVYHVADAGAFVFALDAVRGTTRALLGPMPALARDFTFDARRNEIVFARAVARAAAEYEVVALAADGSGALRTLYRAPSDHMMPRALHDGLIALSTPFDHGLALLAANQFAQPATFAHLGDGSDAVLAESHDARWLAVRHTNATSESLALVDRTTRTTLTLSSAHTLTVFAGFAPREVSP
jgi:hypothetical protein